ncbi:MAG: AI-2E family transporter [Oscillospiraceae bacterium]
MNKTQIYIKISAIALVALVFVLICQNGLDLSLVLGAIAPLVVGAVIAYLVNIIMVGYEKIYFPKSKAKFFIKSRRPVCMVAALLTIIAIIVLVIALIVPELGKAIKLLIQKLPEALEWLFSNEQIMKFLPEDFLNTVQNINWVDSINKVLDFLKDKVGAIAQTVSGAISSVFGGITNFVIGLIFALYLLASKEKLGSQVSELMENYLPKKWDTRLRHLFSTANRCFNSFIVGQVTDACILGLLCTLGLLIMRMPYAPMIGVLVGFTALIPIVGGYIGAGVGAFLILTESPIKALIFLIFLVLLQQFEGNLIYPKIVGDKVGLPAIWVLAAVTIGGGLGGIFGMLLGVPTAATIYSLLRENIYKRREERALLEGEAPAAEASSAEGAAALHPEPVREEEKPKPAAKSAPKSTSAPKNIPKKKTRRRK